VIPAVIVATLAVLVSTMSARSKIFEGRDMTSKSISVAQVFEQTKTVCVGRFLIDVPSSAEVVYGPAHVGWEINRVTGAAVEMGKTIEARLAKIESERRLADPADFGPNSMYGKVINGDLTGQKLVFGRSSDIAYRLQSYVPLGKDLYIQEARPMLSKDEYTEAMSELNSVAKRLRERRDDEIPAEPGLCIDGAFVTDAGAPDYEWVTLGIRLAEFSDVHFSVSMTKKDALVASDALEPRLAQAEEEAKRSGAGGWFSRIKVFRRGPRQVGKWKGFEVLARKPAQEREGESHEFAFLSQGEPKNPLLPVLDVQLDTGVEGNQVGATRPSVTDEEAIAIWDRLISTIRVRPIGGASAASVSPNPVSPLGARTVAGEKCPASGWWHCSDGGDNVGVSGGRLQYLRVGQAVPQALLLTPATPWQKLRGEQPTFRSETPSSWKLVDRRKNARSAPSTLLAPAGESQIATSDETTKHQIDVLGRQASTQIGAQLTSGAICTASGWWQCLEPGALDNTRWFSSGAALPPATKPVSLTVLEKMKGLPGFVRVPASWRFIRFADSETPVSTEGSATSAASSSGADKDGPSQGA
jgi:hypothetical protein